MIFGKSISVLLNTLPASPLKTEIDVGPGILRRVWIRWRWGVGNLGGCRIKCHEFQYWPLTRGQWFPSSVEPLEFEEDMDLGDLPLQFVVEAYNLDDSYPHTLWVAFNVLRPGPAPLTAGELMEIFATPALPPAVY